MPIQAANTLQRVTSVAKYEPNYEEATTLIQYMDTEQLQGLLDSEEKLREFINDLQQVKNIQVDREMLLASNKSLADYNLSKEPLLKEGGEKLATLYEEAQRSRDVLLKDKEQLDNQTQNQSPDTVHALLQTEAAKSEEETEKMAEEFLDGNIGVDVFVQKFIEERTVAHLRRIKAEKMGELLQTKAWGMPSYGQQLSGSQASYASGPYPTPGYSMPEPSSYYPR